MLERSVSEEDFLKIFSQRELPFSSNSLIDYPFQLWDKDEIAKHRKWIAALYRKYSSITDKIKLGSGSIKEILTDKVLWNRRFSSSLKQSVFQYLNNVELRLKLSVNDLYNLFLSDFETNKTSEWMLELNMLSILEPDYKEVSFYLSQFYQAVRDEHSLRKLLLDHNK